MITADELIKASQQIAYVRLARDTARAEALILEESLSGNTKAIYGAPCSELDRKALARAGFRFKNIKTKKIDYEGSKHYIGTNVSELYKDFTECEISWVKR